MGNTKKVETTDFVSEIKPVANYPDFEKMAHVRLAAPGHRSRVLPCL